MIIGTGIDAVEIARFAEWHTKPLTALKRIFSDTEIAYCLSNKILSAERFAVRFAAREAVYKVISIMPEVEKIPFLTLARALTITKKSSGAPILLLDWQKLGFIESPKVVWHVSLAHTKTIAIASIIAEQS